MLRRPQNLLSSRSFSVLQTPPRYPPSLLDKHKISPINDVPSHIQRPSYVGKKPQNHPPLSDPIRILGKDQIAGLKAASKLASQTL